MLPSFIHLGANGLLFREVTAPESRRPARWRVSRLTLRVARKQFNRKGLVRRPSAERRVLRAYSHAGLIQAAFATSPRWAEVL
jgi:hypothetical protein